MKKVVLLIGLIYYYANVFSQTESTFKEKKMKYGFNVGVNYPNVLDRGGLPDNASKSNNVGFQLGVLAEYKVFKLFSISPKAELSFNNGKINFINVDGTQSRYRVMPISLDFMAHFIFKDQKEKLSPYFYFGPNIKIPISKKSDNSAVYSTKPDFAIDFGIGIDKAFAHFNFSPELRYSIGLLNINRNPSIQSLYFHKISLIFNLMG
jgi:hypothetical protein